MTCGAPFFPPTYSPHRIRNSTPVTRNVQLTLAHILGYFFRLWEMGAEPPLCGLYPFLSLLLTLQTDRGCKKFRLFYGVGGMVAP